MTHGKLDRSLSELELAALGHLWRHGPCTAYRVRLGFRESKSSHWSGSSGAIYPLLRRLENRGLVKSSPGTTGARPSKLLAVTADGRAALREWLGRTVDLDAASEVYDGLRTRIFFLDLLPPEARLDFLRSALRACQEHIAAVAKDLEARRASGDRFGALAARGAWHSGRARLVWLREIAAELGADDEVPGPDTG